MPWTWYWACREVTITASTHRHLHIPLVSSVKHVMELALHEFPVMRMMQGSSTTDHTQNCSAVKLLDLIVPGLLQVHLQPQVLRAVRLGRAHMGHGCAHLLRLRGLPAPEQGHHPGHRPQQGALRRQGQQGGPPGADLFTFT